MRIRLSGAVHATFRLADLIQQVALLARHFQFQLAADAVGFTGMGFNPDDLRGEVQAPLLDIPQFNQDAFTGFQAGVQQESEASARNVEDLALEDFFRSDASSQKPQIGGQRVALFVPAVGLITAFCGKSAVDHDIDT